MFRLLCFSLLLGALLILPDRLASPLAITEGTFAQRYDYFSALPAATRANTLVFIGSSQTLRHVVPSVLAEATGARAFNLGHRGLRTATKISVARHLLEHALEPGATLVIEDGVIAAHYLDPDLRYRDSSLSLYTSGQFLDDLWLAHHAGGRFALDYGWSTIRLYWLSRFKVGIDQVLKVLAPDDQPWTGGDGYLPFSQQRAVAPWPGAAQGKPPKWFRPHSVDCSAPAVKDQVAMSLFRYEQLERLAKQRDVRLLVHVIPRYRYKSAAPNRHAKVKDCVVDRLPQHLVVDLRAQTSQHLRRLLSDPGSYQNAGHLNDRGARRYSLILADSLKRHPERADDATSAMMSPSRQ